MVNLTPTKLRDLILCPQMYKLKHLDRRGARNTNPALAFGCSIHAALEELHRPVDEHDGGSAPSESCEERWAVFDPEALIARHWQNAYVDEAESDAYRASASAALARYAEVYCGDGTWHDETIGVEVFLSRVFNADGFRIRLGCKADRIIVARDGALEIIDYKTASNGKVPTKESLCCDVPTFIYYLLGRVCYPGHPTVRVSFLNVLSLARVDVTYNEAQVTANKAALLAYARRAASGEFAARPCDACAWCSVRNHCPLFGGEVAFASA